MYSYVATKLQTFSRSYKINIAHARKYVCTHATRFAEVTIKQHSTLFYGWKKVANFRFLPHPTGPDGERYIKRTQNGGGTIWNAYFFDEKVLFWTSAKRNGVISHASFPQKATGKSYGSKRFGSEVFLHGNGRWLLADDGLKSEKRAIKCPTVFCQEKWADA